MAHSKIPKTDNDIYKLALHKTMTGNPDISNYLLKKISLEKSFQDRKHLLFAYNFFIKEDYKKFSMHLKKIKRKDLKMLKQTCSLKAYNDLIFSESTFDKICKKITTNSTLFIDSLASLKTGNNDNIQRMIDTSSRDTSEVKSIKSILKSSIFTGNEEFILDYLTLFPDKIFKYSSIRELLGIIFFRLRDFTKAEKLIRPVQTVNAKNILGNIEIERGNIEIAFGYFLEAYKKDITSLNAIKKLIPLTWKLGKFELLAKLINIFPAEDERKILIRSASLLKLRKYKKSIKEMASEEQGKGNNIPIINILLKLSANLNLDKDIEALNFSKEACKRNNSIACDILFYLYEIKNVKRFKDIITDVHEKVEIDVNGLKSQVNDYTIDEPKLISQRDIEELDDQVQFKKSIKNNTN